MNKYALPLFLILALILAACGSVAVTPTPTPTPDPCQVPQNWENGGRLVELRDSGGNVVGSLQLFLDEENGALLIEGKEPALFPPGSKGEITIGEKKTEFYFGCDGNFYFPPGTIHVAP